jgi:U3 small nucleolar RNA-associated protein 22
MFSPKDRLDYRYFHKRSHYLAVIKSAITEAFSKDAALREVQVEWTYAMDDARRPIILLKSGKAQGLKYATEIKIHASLPSDVFTPPHLSPAKSLCRFNSTSATHTEEVDASDKSAEGTPLYAASIAHDNLHKSHLLHLHRLSTSLGPATERHLASFLALWRTWATQRAIPASRGASAWFAGMLLGWVVHGGRIGGQGGVRDRTKEVKGLGKGLGYWGCLRAVWEFVARTDFRETPVWIGHAESPIPLAQFVLPRGDGTNVNVMVDPEGMVNVLSGWEDGEVQLLRHHARETLAMLEDHSVDRFAEVFARAQRGRVGVFDEVVV